MKQLNASWHHALDPSSALYSLRSSSLWKQRLPMNGERLVLFKKWSAVSSALAADCTTHEPRFVVVQGATDIVTLLEQQQLVWQHFAPDPAQWWDYRRPDDSHSRDLILKEEEEEEAVWLKASFLNPSWMDSLVSVWEAKVRVLRRICEQGELRDAVQVLDALGCHTDDSLLYQVLTRCVAEKDLVSGRRVHALAVKCGYNSDSFFANHLIRMYSALGKLEEAAQAFTKVAAPNAYVWATMIRAHARHGRPAEAMNLYRQMRGDSSVKPDNHVFVAALKACAIAGDLASGKEIHADILRNAGAVEPDVVTGNCLVDMYAKCGSLADARDVFDRLGSKDVVTWTTMIAGYAQHGLGQEALSLYDSMQQDELSPPNLVTFVCLLQACATVGALSKGKQLHALIRQRGLESDVVVGGALVDMYAKCGSLLDARRVFDALPTRNAVTWSAMVSGYARHGLGEEALTLHGSMCHHEGSKGISHLANQAMFVSLLQACGSIGALHQGQQLHAQIRHLGLESDLVVASCLVDMYAKCRRVDAARELFDRLPTRDVVTWNAMLTGYVDNGLCHEALALRANMQREGVSPTDHTFVCLLKACASVGALSEGKLLHAQVEQLGLEANMFVGNCLVDMYAKCGRLDDARRVFERLPARDVVTWTALLNGYTQHYDGRMAVECFQEMLQQGVKPNDKTFICLLTGCSRGGMVHEGQQYLKSMVDEYGLVATDYHYNCMVDLLGRSGCLDAAESLLLTMPIKNSAVGWTSLLSACKSRGDVERGRRCFNRLLSLEPTYASSYVIMASTYANAGSWSNVAEVERLRQAAGAWKKPATAFIEVKNRVYAFTVGTRSFQMVSKLKSMNSIAREDGGHVPQTELVLRALPEHKKQDALCGHAEKLALAYGLLNTPNSTTLLITKSLRMCSDCHSSTKIISRLERREIVVRDAHCVHRFVDGSCTCGDCY